MTYDGAQMQIIRDGLDAGITAKSGNLRENTWAINIGNSPGNTDTSAYSWDGKIDEVRTLLKQDSLVIAYAGGDDFKISEAYTKGSIRRRDPGGPVGVREHGT